MKVKFLDLQKQTKCVRQAVERNFIEIIDTSSFIGGKFVRRFEEDFAEYCGVKYCVATNSGTSALHVALLTSLVDDEIYGLTPPNSFFATTEAIFHAKRIPSFCDVDDTANIDKERRMGLYNFALPVSLYGNPADLGQFENRTIVHDAAQAHGALIGGEQISKFAKTTCFSFYAGKNLGAWGEGGCLVTDSKEVCDCARQLINHGQSEKYIHEEIGFNYRMSEFSAASLSPKLKLIDEWNDARIEIARRYEKNLKGKVKLLDVKHGNKCVWHIYPVFIEERNRVRAKLGEEGIETGLHYPRLISDSLGYNSEYFPHARRLSEAELSLPMHPFLLDDEIDYVSEKLLGFVKK